MEMYEKYSGIFADREGKTIRVGEKAEFEFDCEPEADVRYTLFVAGNTALHYQHKSEFGYPTIYESIEDALDTVHAGKARYCLNLTRKEPQNFTWYAHKKVGWKPFPMNWYINVRPVPPVWQVGVFAKAANLKVEQDGFLRMVVEFLTGEDKTEKVYDFPEGTYDYTRIGGDIAIPEGIDAVSIWFEGRRYSGEFYLERPFLSTDKSFGPGEVELLGDFATAVPRMERFDWAGFRLSRKEWPEFEISLNGKRIFSGEIFERCHCASDWDIEVPKGALKKHNVVSYKLVSAYRDPLPYTFYEVALLAKPAGDFAIIANSQACHVGGKARILVRTEVPDVEVAVESSTPALIAPPVKVLHEVGLHGITLDCTLPVLDAEVTLTALGKKYKVVFPQVAVKTADGVITGSGDLIYIYQSERTFTDFLSFWLKEGLGDLITVRPAYRWSGTRVLDEAAWALFKRVLNELDMKCVHMVDGRGFDTNPDEQQLKFKGFLGKQNHECDGRLWYNTSYSRPSPFSDLMGDVSERCYEQNKPHTVKNLPRRTSPPKTYSEAHDYSIEYMKKEIEVGGFTRHTGPSVLFKYFREAGYRFIGAETTYQSTESQLAFIRGVAKDMGGAVFGTHNAIQWSSSPHDIPERYRRYRLSLYTAYMQGASVINTEEGLWRLEENYVRFHRFTPATVNHRAQQRDFDRYIQTHSRVGKFHTPVAGIHGRLDGHTWWGNTWGISGVPTEADRSWMSLRVFYPMLEPGHIYRHGFPADQPQGWYTGTPYGSIDVVPIECNPATLKDYKLAAMFGFNKCERADMEKMLGFVKAGGTLMLTLAHFNVCDAHARLLAGQLEFDSTVRAFTDGEPRFVEAHVGGKPVNVCVNVRQGEVLERTDEGQPLVLSYACEKGRAVLFACANFPACEAIKPLYERYLETFADEFTAAENVYVRADKYVSTAIYRVSDTESHVYVLAADWYRDPDLERTARLFVSGREYEVSLKFGTLVKVVVNADTAAYCHSENGEVLSVTPDGFTVQGTGSIDFSFLKNGKHKTLTVTFDTPVKTIKF